MLLLETKWIIFKCIVLYYRESINQTLTLGDVPLQAEPTTPFRLSLSNYIDSIREKRVSDKSAINNLNAERSVENSAIGVSKTTFAEPSGEKCSSDTNHRAHPVKISFPLERVREHQNENTDNETYLPGYKPTTKNDDVSTSPNKQTTQVDVHVTHQSEFKDVHNAEHQKQIVILKGHVQQLCETETGGNGRCQCDCECCRSGEAHLGNWREARSISEIRAPHIEPRVEVPIFPNESLMKEIIFINKNISQNEVE